MEATKIQTVIVKYSLLYGLASFIPVPLVDEYTQEVLFRRMLHKIFNHYDQPLSHPNAKRLSQKGGSFCWGCVAGLLLWPIKKFIKTVAFFLSFKSLSDEIASCSLRAIAYQEALRMGWKSEDEEKVLQLKQVVSSIAKQETSSVISVVLAILESSKRGIRMLLWGILRRVRSETEEDIDPKLIAPIYDALFSNETRQESIRTKLSQALSLPLPQPQPEEADEPSGESEQNRSQIRDEKEEE